MRFRHFFIWFYFCILGGFFIAACGVSDRNPDPAGTASTSLNQTEFAALPLSAAIQAANQALSSAELTLTSTLGSIETASQCPTAVSGCGGNLRTITFSDCTWGTARITGLATLTYDSNSTCLATRSGIPSSGYVLRTSTGLRVFFDNGESELIHTDPRQNYKQETVGGGTLVQYIGPMSYSVNIIGTHRVRTNSNGSEIYNLTIRAAAPLIASGSLMTRDRFLASGIMTVDHNLLRQSSVVRFTNLRWSNNNCCHPVSGLLSTTILDSGGRELGRLDANLVNGASCGTVEVTLTRGSVVSKGFISLRSCE